VKQEEKEGKEVAGKRWGPHAITEFHVGDEVVEEKEESTPFQTMCYTKWRR
jgi:hypothetical protein